MDNSRIDKLYTIYQEALKGKNDSVAALANHIEKMKPKSFMYKEGAGLKLCELSTITSYIRFMRQISALSNSMEPDFDMKFNNSKGFNRKLSEYAKRYLDSLGLTSDRLHKISSKILEEGKLPTTERVLGSIETPSNVSASSINRSFSVLAEVGQLNLDMCQKLIWLPKGKFEL